jgi:hypothetical protein
MASLPAFGDGIDQSIEGGFGGEGALTKSIDLVWFRTT